MSLTRQVLILIFVSLLLNTLFILLLSLYQQKNFHKTAETVLVQTLSQSLRDAVVRDVIDQNKLRVTDLLKEIKNNSASIEFIYLVGNGNFVFAHSFERGFPRYLFKNLVHEDKLSGLKHVHRYETKNGLINEYSIVLIPGIDMSMRIGINQTQSRMKLTENATQIVLGSTAVTLLLLFVVLWVAARTIRPLKHLSTLMSEYKEGERLHLEAVETKTPEVRQLTLALQSAFEERDRSYRTIKEREQDLLITLNSIGDGVISTDDQGRVVKMNPVAQTLTGWSMDAAHGKPMKTIFPIFDASTRDEMQDPAERVISDGKIIYLTNHTTLIAKDGTEHQIADSAAPIINSEGEISGVVVVFHDVTEQYRLREKTKSTLEQLERIFENSTSLFAVLELDGTVVFVNNISQKMTGLERSQTIGGKFWKNEAIVYAPRVETTVREMIERAALGKGNESKDIQIMTLKGLRWISLDIHPVCETSGNISQIIVEGVDVSERKEAEMKIAHQAHYDALTDLPNRILALDRLSQLINEAKRNMTEVAVLFLDLDNFKNYNDTLGHDVGDEILIATAKRLSDVMRNSDSLGRLGGDEFIVLIGDVSDPLDAHKVAENILRCFDKPYEINGRELKLTTSIGIAIFPNDGRSIKELLKNSDTAMYHAKKQGRNRFSFFAEDMNQKILHQLILEEKMYIALERKEFEVYYQPKIEISSGKIMGVEALLRWYNKDIGHIRPDEFIPVAEKNNFIIKLGNFVLSEALQELSLWKEYIGSDFQMAINLSPVQFKDKNLLGTIEEQMQAYKIDAASLEFEITENVLIQEEVSSIKLLDQFNKMGINIAMDDFGTGYSSLSYLRSHPFDILKIDKSFIMDMMEDIKDQALVSAAISMAKALGLKVVAEGVETKEQFLLLKEMQCDYAQGYLIGKPVPASEIREVIKQDRHMTL